jgi:hypothetical protein
MSAMATHLKQVSGENRMGQNMHSAGPLRPEHGADSEPVRK